MATVPDVNCHEVELSKINLNQLELVKESVSRIDGEDHSRWVFFDRSTGARSPTAGRFVKIWNPRHVRRNTVVDALNAGFYDRSIAASLYALIFHKGVCRGYVSDPCTLTYRHDRQFDESLRRRSADCAYFAIQYSKYHIGLVGDRYSLFDLEGVHPLAELPSMPSLRSYFDNAAYRDFILTTFAERHPERRNEVTPGELMQQPSRAGKLKERIDHWPVVRQMKLARSAMHRRLRTTPGRGYAGVIEY